MGEFMKNQLLLLMLCLAFAIRISGQTQQAGQVPVVITSDYYAAPKVLVLHALNNSGRDIVGYTFIIRRKNSDGGWSSASSDMLDLLISMQMAKDPGVSESIRQQGISYESVNAAGHGIFGAGTTRDMTVSGESGPEVDIGAGVVFYTDGSFDRQDEKAFKHMLAARQGELLAMKKVNEIIKGALADPANEHPATAAISELTKSAAEAMAHKTDGPYDTEHLRAIHMQNDFQNLRSMQGATERERLMQYVEEQDKRIELMTPHCHLEIALK